MKEALPTRKPDYIVHRGQVKVWQFEEHYLAVIELKNGDYISIGKHEEFDGTLKPEIVFALFDGLLKEYAIK